MNDWELSFKQIDFREYVMKKLSSMLSRERPLARTWSSILYATLKRLWLIKIIRAKLAEMASKVEANHALLESIVHQANNMSEVEFMLGLGGPIAGLKGMQTG